MSTLTVMRVGPYDYQIMGDDVNVSVKSFDLFGSRPIAKMSGKGSRKIKTEIPELLKDFVKEENEKKRKAIKEQAVAFCSKAPEIKPGNIYSVTVAYAINDEYGYEDDTQTSTFLLDYQSTMLHIKRNIAIDVKQEMIRNTAIYTIGSFIGSGKAPYVREEKRLFVLLNGIKLTGLALKEMAKEGRRFYKLYEDKRRLETIEDEANRFDIKQSRAVFGLLAEEKEILDIDMVERFRSEVARAKAAPE
ncbi:hypothetical protein [Brevibacillus reuszeri]|uniref:hypothetical protein n=1 Tax=Brevibacillus reuszeri TaxID=54915 RepID=UPI000CCC24DE|nr:hypothetical protein [Brevibacillus reuszeri]